MAYFPNHSVRQKPLALWNKKMTLIENKGKFGFVPSLFLFSRHLEAAGG
jgi:hypothetical protein